ncbi:partial Translation initiation factor IF-2, partial [Gammaproteobacteria bacterium]
LDGIIGRGHYVRVIRDGHIVVPTAEDVKRKSHRPLASLRRFKDDVKEVKEGYECGIGIENFNDIKVGDVIECYRKEEVARTLQSAAAAT